MNDSVRQPLQHDSVTVVRWERKPGDNPMVKFIIFSALGLVPGLALAFMPGLGGLGATTLFTALFATILTIPAIAGQRSFMLGLTKRVNDTIVEVTGSSRDRLSVKQLRRLIASGEPLPLTVSGLPGLRLHAKRLLAVEADAPQKWAVKISAVPQREGVASFDRLLSAALSARSEGPGAS
ncbi:hypothetical protein [Paenarthrobacter sp. FR1]|uniref:hypothetical protein n=1 Tax=Paenarthrobacter sp. FR1 TaxID=3439548 RepID=UPI003DA3C21A